MEFLNPEKILNEIFLKEDAVVADFGCGSGTWTIALAKILPEGKIYAIDLLDEPLSVLRSKIKLEIISNIDIIKADVERNTRILSENCDLVLMTNLLFEVENKIGVFEEAKRVLKPEGKILIVDWKETSPFGPEKKISYEEIEKIAEKLNLKIEKKFNAGTYHFGLILRK